MEQYIRQKTRVFRQLHIRLTDEHLAHMLGLKSEIAIDNYCEDIIMASL